jgi:flagellar FliL protein
MAKKPAKDAKDDSAEEAPKGGGMIKKLIMALVLVSAGAGGAYGAFAAGLIGGGDEDKGPDLPKPIAKGDEDPYAPPAGKDDGAMAVYGEGGSEYRTTYFSFEESFTSNLKDSAGLVQLSLAVSTRHDGRVLQWLTRHELALRSAVLVELASTPEEDVYTIAGKEALNQRLTKAINAVLTDQEGFGGVDKVHFKTFLIQ